MDPLRQQIQMLLQIHGFVVSVQATQHIYQDLAFAKHKMQRGILHQIHALAHQRYHTL